MLYTVGRAQEKQPHKGANVWCCYHNHGHFCNEVLALRRRDLPVLRQLWSIFRHYPKFLQNSDLNSGNFLP